MLSMKTLRVAIVTMGSALLLGSGLALAQTDAIDLDGTMAEAPSPILIATQTIPAADATSMTRHVNLGADAAIAISPGIRLEENDRYFLRIALGGGAMFRGAVAVTGAGTVQPVQGGSGAAQAVFRLGTVLVDATIQVGITDNIGLPSNGAAEYTASMTVHAEQFDAIDGIGRIRSIGAEDVGIISAVSGIDSTITSGNAVADVGVGFLWFVGPSSAMPNVSGVGLGTATAMAAMGQQDVLNAATGAMVANADLINETGVTIGVEGDFSVGAWDLAMTMPDDPNTPEDESDVCPNRVGTASVPGEGGLMPMEDNPNMAMMAGLAPGTYQLCVEVDTAGAMSNAMAIPAGEYMATVYTRNSTDARDDMMQNEGAIGMIGRNGASVNIAYLTDADIYNQRLILVNRNMNRDVEFIVSGMQTEEGTMVMVNELEGGNMIGAGETRVIRVSDLFSFDGKNRLGATLSFNATPGDISVATSQINLDDFSTDTVMWPVQ